MDLEHIIYAFLGGVLPALVWLTFWLREDRKKPEPKNRLFFTFILGMLAVLFAVLFQKGVAMIIPGMGLLTIFLWALIEEFVKFIAGYFGGIHTADDNEPIDPIIYMITAALGFAAAENFLFILGPLIGDDIPRSIITGNLRFIGASLLHVVASGIVGVSLAFSFYKSRAAKHSSTISALGCAVIFHTVFNMLIINLDDLGAVLAFLAVWVGVTLILLAFERAKSLGDF